MRLGYTNSKQCGGIAGIFKQLVSAAYYGDQHPEFKSFINQTVWQYNKFVM